MSRIDPTSITPTVARQTPKNDFGEVLNRAAQGVSRLGGAVVGAVGGVPVLSAAVSAVTQVAQLGAVAQASQVAPATVTGGVVNVGGGASGGARAPQGLGPPGPDRYDASVVDQMREASLQSLYLQCAVSQESREYNAISNVLKTRHDSAKAAINNIR